jgi:tetratricopeptide (TPR) repeat protein
MLEDFEVMAAAKALAQGDFTLAWMNVRQVLENFPRHPQALLTAGLAAQATGNHEAAKHLMLEALLRDPANPDAQKGLLKVFLADQEASFALPADPLAGLMTLMTALPELGHIPLALGLALEARGQKDQANGPYLAAARLMAAHGLATTRLSLIELDRSLGSAGPRAPSQAPLEKRIAMSDLGERGRFGNQIVQYLFLLCHSLKHGLIRETPEWLGDRLFQLGGDAALTQPPLPCFREPESGSAPWLAPDGPSLGGRDLAGYFALPTRHYLPWRNAIQKAFAPAPALAGRAQRIKELIASRGRTLVALHLRITQEGHEYSRNEAPLAWYADWLDGIWKDLDAPVLYVASNDQQAVQPGLARFSPLSGTDLGPPLKGAEFIDDFLALSMASHLGLSRSSFSQTASLLAGGLIQAVYPDREQGRLVPVDPWNAPLFLA